MSGIVRRLAGQYILLGFLILTCPAAEARIVDTGDWLVLPMEANGLSVLSEEELLYLDGSGNARRLNTESGRVRRMAGRFKLLKRGPKGRIWAATGLGNVFFLRNGVWRGFDSEMPVDDLSITENRLFILSKGRIHAYSHNGEKRPTPERLAAVTDAVSLHGSAEGGFVLLRDNGVLARLGGEEDEVLEQDIHRVLLMRPDLYILRNKIGKLIFQVRQQQKSRRIVADNSAEIVSMAVSPAGRLWALGGRGVYRVPFTLANLRTGKDDDSHRRALKFAKMKLTALRLFAGPDGVFRLNPTGTLELWSPKKKEFIEFPGRVVELAVAGNGQLWAINALGRIFHFDDGEWKQQSGLATSISARGEDVLIVDGKWRVRRYDWGKKAFVKNGFTARFVAVQNQAVFWLVKEKGDIFRCAQGRCHRIEGKAEKISISPEGVVFMVDDKGHLHRYDGRKFRNVKTPGDRVIDMAAGLKGLPWILDEENVIHAAYAKKAKAAEVAGEDVYEPVKSSSHTDTLGVGAALVSGMILKSGKLSKSADAPNAGFVFEKRMKITTVPNTVYFVDFAMGRDGRLWGLRTDRVFQYLERDEKFRVYKTANFSRADQPYHGLPSGITVASIISGADERIWVVPESSTTVYWQKKKGGSFTSTEITKAETDITDITIDVAGNVYVAAGEIYRRDAGKKSFYKFYAKGRPFVRVSSGPAGTLWAVNSSGQAYELVAGKMEKRPRKGVFTVQDVDISVDGVVYATSKTHTTADNEPGAGVTVSPISGLICRLRKWNARNGSFDRVGKFKHAQFVAVSKDGTPWMTCAPSGNTAVYRGKN